MKKETKLTKDETETLERARKTEVAQATRSSSHNATSSQKELNKKYQMQITRQIHNRSTRNNEQLGQGNIAPVTAAL